VSYGVFGKSSSESLPARRALYCVVALHALLLLLMLPDYMADNDLGYHISIGRQYGEQGHYFWDHLNWAPTGRPNLQGPLLHYGIGLLGRLLGGEGDDYVLAFSLLAVLQWAVAVFTAVFFARRYGGDVAALIAAALFTGSVWSAAPFFVGVPSGWIFILTPWAIHHFLRDRYVVSAILTSAVVGVHLGGAAVAPLGVLLAAAFTRRWRGLVVTGLLTVILTTPYTFHVLRHMDWYTGRRGHVAGSFATLTYLLAVPGFIWLLRRPKANLFLLLWAVAPIAWAFQDNLRFMLQSTVAASAIAGIFVASMLFRLGNRSGGGAVLAGLVLTAQIFPLSIPALPVELAWAAGRGFPRELDWREARALADVLTKAGVRDRIVHSYYDSLSAAMAVYAPLRQEFGHWGEVRPPVNPAREISAGERVYVLPIPPDDPVLERFSRSGWVTAHGGGKRTSLVTLPRPAPLEESVPVVVEVIVSEANRLADEAVNNRMPPPTDLFSRDRLIARARIMDAQRARAGRIQTAVLIYAYALEERHPEIARDVRAGVRAWGSVANFIGDETAIDYVGDARFERFRENLRLWAAAVADISSLILPTPEVGPITDQLFDDFFG
jgi:hypothetical protein